MIAYASRTGTKRNLARLRVAGWRLLVSAAGELRTEGFPYALDNGAWTAHQKGTAFDVGRFQKALALLGRDADWTVVPDIVAGGAASLARLDLDGRIAAESEEPIERAVATCGASQEGGAR